MPGSVHQQRYRGGAVELLSGCGYGAGNIADFLQGRTHSLDS